MYLIDNSICLRIGFCLFFFLLLALSIFFYDYILMRLLVSIWFLLHCDLGRAGLNVIAALNTCLNSWLLCRFTKLHVARVLSITLVVKMLHFIKLMPKHKNKPDNNISCVQLLKVSNDFLDICNRKSFSNISIYAIYIYI